MSDNSNRLMPIDLRSFLMDSLMGKTTKRKFIGTVAKQ